MGIRDWITIKAIEARQKQAATMDNSLIAILEAKARKLKKRNKLTVDNMVAGWKALSILGYTEAQIREKSEKIIKEEQV